MADFDNGLPSNGTDITDNSISSVNINSSDADQAGYRDINSVNINSSDADQANDKAMNGAMISDVDAGRNSFFVYYL